MNCDAAYCQRLVTRSYRLGKRADARAETRERILGVATESIAASGFRPVSVDEIASVAGTSRATVYRLFGTKLGLFEAVAWNVLATAGIERLDEARRLADARAALRTFLYENCRLFDKVGGALRATLAAAREEPDVASILEMTYYGRRVDSVRDLAARLATEGVLDPNWTVEGAVDVLLILTSAEAFETLTRRRGHSWAEAAERLIEMTAAFTT